MSDSRDPTLPVTLLADIGGTNTRVALATGGQLIAGTIRRFANAGRPALWPILHEYMATEGLERVAAACVCAAGPVDEGVATLTNLSWVFSEADLARETGAKEAAVLNDLAAQGHALDSLAPGALREVMAGKALRHGACRIVIGVGTGFNAAPVFRTPAGRLVPPSEAGHVTLPAPDAITQRLHAFITDKTGFADVEEVLSGRGVVHCYDFIRSETGEGEPLDAAQVMDAIAKGDPRARAAGKLFVQVLGTVAGDLALLYMPYGGIHLIGGVSRAFAPYLSEFGFAEAFHAKGRFSEFNRAFTVSVVEDDYAALSGCAAFLHDRNPG